MAGQLDCFGATHIGNKRTANEDQFLIADLNKSLRVHQTSLGLDHQTRLFGNSQGKLLLVADGMGGHEAGERASTLAVDGIATYALNTMRWFFRLDEQSDDDFQDDLKAAMEHCQDALSREVEASPQRKGMGTTLTMGYIIWPRLYVVHVGDSRCYLHHNGKLQQLTRDHTMAQLYEESQSSRLGDEPSHGRQQHVLWNVIGGHEEDLTPEVSRSTLEMGDTLLLCTDGLTRHVDDDELKRRLSSDASAEELCETLIQRALDGGGSDNVTVVVGKFCEPVDETCRQKEAEASPDAQADTVPFG